MKRLGLLLKTTMLGGLFVMLPAVLVGLLAVKAIGAVRSVAANVIGLITRTPGSDVSFPMFWAVALVLTLSFLFGLLASSRRISKTGQRFEQTVLYRIPGYAVVKNLINGLSGRELEGVVKPALVSGPDDFDYFAFVMEDNGGEHLTMFVPTAPTSASGSVQIVPRSKVQILDVRLTAVVGALNQWGVGTQKILAGHLKNSPPPVAIELQVS